MLRGSRYTIAQKVAPIPLPRWAKIDVKQFRQPTKEVVKPECFRLRAPKNHQLMLLHWQLNTHEVFLLQPAQIAELKLLQETASCQLFTPLTTLPDADCLGFLEEIPQNSGNLFEPLERARSDGKRYTIWDLLVPLLQSASDAEQHTT